jgi:hypothetical protein
MLHYWIMHNAQLHNASFFGVACSYLSVLC